jgi:hypothetical protein
MEVGNGSIYPKRRQGRQARTRVLAPAAHTTRLPRRARDRISLR